MDLLWETKFISASVRKIVVEVPQLTITYSAAAYERWCVSRKRFLQSEDKRFSVFGEYAEIARCGRFQLPRGHETPTKRFYEYHTALLLNREHFMCWGGVTWFEKGRTAPAEKKVSKANTRQVRSMRPWHAPWRWPSDIQANMKIEPTNPDILASSEERDEWRFCEVKEGSERIRPGQLEGLAVLHLLTSAPVAIVRVVEGVSDSTSQRSWPPKQVTIAYKKRARLDWLHPDVRERLSRKFNRELEAALKV